MSDYREMISKPVFLINIRILTLAYVPTTAVNNRIQLAESPPVYTTVRHVPMCSI